MPWLISELYLYKLMTNWLHLIILFDVAYNSSKFFLLTPHCDDHDEGHCPTNHCIGFYCLILG